MDYFKKNFDNKFEKYIQVITEFSCDFDDNFHILTLNENIPLIPDISVEVIPEGLPSIENFSIDFINKEKKRTYPEYSHFTTESM